MYVLTHTSTVVPPYPLHWFLKFQLPWLNSGPEAEDPLWMYSQKDSSSLPLCHSAYIIHLISSYHTGILS